MPIFFLPIFVSSDIGLRDVRDVRDVRDSHRGGGGGDYRGSSAREYDRDRDRGFRDRSPSYSSATSSSAAGMRWVRRGNSSTFNNKCFNNHACYSNKEQNKILLDCQRYFAPLFETSVLNHL